jgi:hypothetical protein
MGNCASNPPADELDSRSKPGGCPVTILRHRNNFSIQIQTKRGSAALAPNVPYFQLADGDEYQILLSNESPNNANCDAEVYLDGEYAGLYRIDADTTLALERPTGVNKKFAFKSVINFQREIGGPLSVPVDDGKPPQNGKITVKFKPEMGKPYKQGSRMIEANTNVKTDINLKGSTGFQPDLDCERFSAGSTVFGSASQQSFNTMEAITNYDVQRETIMETYLVVNNLY